MTKTKIYLKAKLLEKPFVLPCLVSLLKLDLGLPPGLVFQSWVPEHILVDNSLVQGDIHRVPCGHEVVVVIYFYKGLDLGLLGDFLLAHGSCHFGGRGDSGQFQPPGYGCKGGLRCHRQCSS